MSLHTTHPKHIMVCATTLAADYLESTFKAMQALSISLFLRIRKCKPKTKTESLRLSHSWWLELVPVRLLPWISPTLDQKVAFHLLIKIYIYLGIKVMSNYILK